MPKNSLTYFISFLKKVRKIVFGETITIPLGVALIILVGLFIKQQHLSWFTNLGGFLVVGCASLILALVLPWHRR